MTVLKLEEDCYQLCSSVLLYALVENEISAFCIAGQGIEVLTCVMNRIIYTVGGRAHSMQIAAYSHKISCSFGVLRTEGCRIYLSTRYFIAT
jgi:hypothetical protein